MYIFLTQNMYLPTMFVSRNVTRYHKQAKTGMSHLPHLGAWKSEIARSSGLGPLREDSGSPPGLYVATVSLCVLTLSSSRLVSVQIALL